MKDGEIGELWARNKDTENDDSIDYTQQIHARIVCNLIRKLVEERARRYGLLKALNDFGIDPKEWK